MEFINGKCPKCHGELQIPSDRDTILCMYCGEQINTSEAADEIPPKESIAHKAMKREAIDDEKYQEILAHLDSGLTQMLFDMEKPMSAFTRKTYTENFNSYCEKYHQVLDTFECAYDRAENTSIMLESAAEHFTDAVLKKLEEISKKRLREEQLLDYNMTMVVFFFPAFLERQCKAAKELTEAVAKSWKEHFPQTNLEPASFERINSGFKRRFCYITTAVCESLHKPDDCYELNVLRNYRDIYLMQQKNGEELVMQYYDVAPTIVKHINKKKDRKEIYYSVWTDYLLPCIHLIESDKNEECMVLYQNMVYDLQEKYFCKETRG